jgi:hypothetical protein
MEWCIAHLRIPLRHDMLHFGPGIVQTTDDRRSAPRFIVSMIRRNMPVPFEGEGNGTIRL